MMHNHKAFRDGHCCVQKKILLLLCHAIYSIRVRMVLNIAGLGGGLLISMFLQRHSGKECVMFLAVPIGETALGQASPCQYTIYNDETKKYHIS